MATASTLSLGQASFSLGPDSDSLSLGTPSDQINVRINGTTTTPSGQVANFFVSNKTVGSPIENLTLDTALSPEVSGTSVSFGSAVSGLDASLGDGNDRLSSNSAISSSSIDMDATAVGGADSFTATGGFFNSTVSTGAGNDTLIFAKEVFDSSIDSGAGNDQVTFQSGSFVSNTSVSTGEGNDVLTFEGAVFGYGENSQISMGTGADTLVFGSNSFVAGYNIDLGSDTGSDVIRFEAGIAEEDGVTITGAGTGDSLVIGAGDYEGTYTYNGTFFSNTDDTLTWLT